MTENAPEPTAPEPDMGEWLVNLFAHDESRSKVLSAVQQVLAAAKMLETIDRLGTDHDWTTILDRMAAMEADLADLKKLVKTEVNIEEQRDELAELTENFDSVKKVIEAGLRVRGSISNVENELTNMKQKLGIY